MTEQDIITIIEKDEWMMDVLKIAEELDLPDWIIGAGFLRNKVWDYLHNYPELNRTDVDLVYFEPNGNDYEADKKLSERVRTKTSIDFEIVNQVYTHTWRKMLPNTSTEQSMSTWSDTATCVGVTIKYGKIKLIAPLGIEDLVNFIVRPNPTITNDIENFKRRVKEKDWLKKWPKLKLVIN
ncbi:nucleotidyltransferase family protein [Candidatus Parcubacteria bacterium]|nr:nucleotidyltransferase family protein [Candidatus Parcubacteria bacterium]